MRARLTGNLLRLCGSARNAIATYIRGVVIACSRCSHISVKLWLRKRTKREGSVPAAAKESKPNKTKIKLINNREIIIKLGEYDNGTQTNIK